MIPNMASELIWLGFAVIIGLVQLLWAAAAAQPQRGLTWNVGPRDTPVVLTGMAGRLERAFTNFKETFPFYVALVFGCYLTGKFTGLATTGSMLYVIARAVYVPLYAFGVPYARSAAWLLSLVGIVMMLIALFQ
jgi:uncharacterized MAPEG superfamily protein